MKVLEKIKDKSFSLQQNVTNKIYDLRLQLDDTVNEAKNTKFTKKGAKIMASVGCGLATLFTPMLAFAANDYGTSTINNFIEFICSWLKKIGIMIMIVGGVMFALGWQREDSEGKTRGLQTLMAGAMVLALGFTDTLASILGVNKTFDDTTA